MTLAIRKGAVAGARSHSKEPISRISVVKDLAGSARKIFLVLSLVAVGAWLTVGVVLFALFLVVILRS